MLCVFGSLFATNSILCPFASPLKKPAAEPAEEAAQLSDQPLLLFLLLPLLLPDLRHTEEFRGGSKCYLRSNLPGDSLGTWGDFWPGWHWHVARVA